MSENNLPKVKYAIYTRVSTQEQTTENQVRTLVKYAQLQDWAYDVFQETESSRKTRPVKQHVLNCLRNGQYEGVLIWKLDRWARSSRELLLEIEELHNKKIKFISITDHINLDSPTGKLQFQILSAFAEFERNLIRERTMEGLARAKVQGKKLGRPFGSQDSKKRKRSGYILKEAKVKQLLDENKGIFKPVEHYINERKEYQKEWDKKVANKTPPEINNTPPNNENVKKFENNGETPPVLE